MPLRREVGVFPKRKGKRKRKKKKTKTVVVVKKESKEPRKESG